MTNQFSATDSTVGNKKKLHQMTVLVVDAVENMRSVISSILTETGFGRVLTTSNGAKAVQLLAVTSVDMVIAEAKLPKLDGLALLQHIRQNELLANIPFIMMSSELEQSGVMQAIELKVSDYIAKPFSARILRARIFRALGQSQPVVKAAVVSDDADKKKLNQQQILVVDDVPDNIQLISSVLRPDYLVKAATSGEIALKICAAEPQPDIVLLDIMMPEMDGFEVCRRLKSNPDTQHITIIFLTAADTSEHIIKGLELGAADYITKPIYPPVMQARVKNHCRMIQDQKAVREQLDMLLQNLKLKQDLQQLTASNPTKLIGTLFEALVELKNTAAAQSPYLQVAQTATEQLSDLLLSQRNITTKN